MSTGAGAAGKKPSSPTPPDKNGTGSGKRRKLNLPLEGDEGSSDRADSGDAEMAETEPLMEQQAAAAAPPGGAAADGRNGHVDNESRNGGPPPSSVPPGGATAPSAAASAAGDDAGRRGPGAPERREQSIHRAASGMSSVSFAPEGDRQFRSASEGSASASAAGTESMLPLSMQLMRPFWLMGGALCPDCVPGGAHLPMRGHASIDEDEMNDEGRVGTEVMPNGTSAAASDGGLRRRYQHGSSQSLQSLSHVAPPLRPVAERTSFSTETLIQQYVSACHLYGCHERINAGVLTTLRFSLPALRTSGSFHDADMLALCEVLLEHGNGRMSYVRRLDFSISSREGKLHGKKGFRSHGAYALGKVLQSNRHIEEVFLQRNQVGPYGSSAIFMAAAENPVLRTLVMRRCRVGERGALAFAEHLGKGSCGLKEVDVSVNQIGFRGCLEVEEALVRARRKGKRIEVDLEGNLVLQEVMNSITHGLGILLCVIGTILLINRVRDKPSRYFVSCSVYSASLLVLYTSSTLFHSFFALTMTRYIFGVLDKCAIYLLIAGSYTPYLRIALANQPLWDVWLLFFIWACCVCGVTVEALFPQWKHRGIFSLAMYLGMGWCCMVCVPDLMAVLPQGAINLLVLGGVGYTAGVPFFVRNNNLDHSIWHLFVLAGSMFHWFGVFSYVCRL